MITTRNALWALSVFVMLAGVAGIAAKTWQMNRTQEQAEAAPDPPVNPQPHWGMDAEGRKFYVNTKGEKEHRSNTFSSWTIAAGNVPGVVMRRDRDGNPLPIVIQESWNTSGAVQSVLRDGESTYLLTREGDMLRVVQVRKGQFNRTLAMFAAPLDPK